MPAPTTLWFALALLALVAALSARVLTALALTAYLLGGVIVSSLVMRSYLGVPLTIADLVFFFGNPIDDLQLFRNYPLLGAGFVALLLGAVLIVVAGVKLERPRLPSIGWRAGACGVAALALALALSAPAAHERPATATANAAGLPDDWDAWTAFEDMRRIEKAGSGAALLDAFFANRGMKATLPPRRASTRFGGAATAASVSATADAARPDLLMILAESVFDPRLIAKCTLPGCTIPMFGAARAGTRSQQGPLVVHTAGGGTWLTEFSFVSGFDWRTFGRGGAYAPVSIAPRLQQSLPRYLQSIGYRTVAVTATGGDFLRARSAYRQYGFEEFYAAQELAFSDDWLGVHDAEVYEKALLALARRADPRPVFLFVLTIRNHGPHGGGEATIPAALQAEKKAYDSPLADYLGRLHDSSAEMAAFQKRWLASPRPRVIGWFGDHQPDLTQWFLETPADVAAARLPPNVTPNERRYVTWYQLAANFGPADARTGTGALDIAYLGPELLRFAQLPLDATSVAALDVAEKCAGRLLGCADRDLVGEFISWRIHELGAVSP